MQDNLSAHKLSDLYEIFAPDRARAIIEKIHIVRTPTHGSWLNVAECELSVLTRQGLKTHVASRQELEEQVKAWYERRNDQQKRVDWQFTTKGARIKLKNYIRHLTLDITLVSNRYSEILKAQIRLWYCPKMIPWYG